MARTFTEGATVIFILFGVMLAAATSCGIALGFGRPTGVGGWVDCGIAVTTCAIAVVAGVAAAFLSVAPAPSRTVAPSTFRTTTLITVPPTDRTGRSEPDAVVVPASRAREN